MRILSALRDGLSNLIARAVTVDVDSVARVVPLKPKPLSAKISKRIKRFLEMRKRNAEHNGKVATRQVVRRRLFCQHVSRVNVTFAGETRGSRRNIARGLMRRQWASL